MAARSIRYARVVGLMMLAGAVQAQDRSIGEHGVAPARPAQRIVALAPHVVELVFAAGAGDRLVGVMAGSDWPPQARRLPVIGVAGRLDRERLVAVAPDLAIGWAGADPAADTRWLRARGVAVHATRIDRLEDIAIALREIGRLAGREREAALSALALERELAAIEPADRGRPSRVYYQVWDRPPMTVSALHPIGQAIDRCGGVNVFASLTQAVATVTTEAVHAADPDRVLAARAGGDPFARWRDRPPLRAVASGRTASLDPDLLHRPGPRMIEGVRQLCAAIASP